jgi:chitinase
MIQRNLFYCLGRNILTIKQICKKGKGRLALLLFAMVMSFLVGQTTCFAETVALSWDANTESNIGGYKVYYKADSSSLPFDGTGAAEGASPVTVYDLTTATISDLDPGRTYYFAVTAYDTTDNESPYSNIVTVLESVPPVVSLSSPANNTAVGGTVSITASASDNVGVTKVEFYVNGLLRATDSASPYAYSWITSSLAIGTYTLTAKAYDAAGNVGVSNSVVVTAINDTTAPVVSLTSPAKNSSVSGTIAVSASASDNVGVSMVEFYRNGALLLASNVDPYEFYWDTTSVVNGSCTLMAIARDSAGNFKQSATLTVVVNNPTADITAPVISVFSLPATATSLTVGISGFSATDAFGVTGYMISESATAPATSSSNWSATAPTTFSFSSAGSKTAYAWAKDAAGNLSSSRSATTTITLPSVTVPPPATVIVPDITAPTVSTFTLPATAVSLLVPVSSLSASDTVRVTGYLITESATAPAASASGWSATSLTTFTFSSAGTKTAYAWAKDAAGNVSNSRSATTTITLPSVTVPPPATVIVPDITAPTVSAFTLPATAVSLLVPVSSLSASDTVRVTGYLITESATAPAASTTGWAATAPTSFTFSAEGAKTAYAWAKDAAGNVSAARTAAVNITLPDVAAPTVGTFTLPATATSLTVPVSGLAATDNKAVTGYLITESAAAPAASAIGWAATAPTSFTFSSEGSKTTYAWAKDAAGNVSAARTTTTSITLPSVAVPPPTTTLPDTTSPTLSDALLALQIGSGKITPTTEQMIRLDVAPVVNGVSVPNGVIDTGDAIVLLSKIVGKRIW